MMFASYFVKFIIQALNFKKVVKLSEIQFEISSFNQELLSVRSMKDVH